MQAARSAQRGGFFLLAARGAPNAPNPFAGSYKLVRTFNRSMIALLGKKLGQNENRSTKIFEIDETF